MPPDSGVGYPPDDQATAALASSAGGPRLNAVQRANQEAFEKKQADKEKAAAERTEIRAKKKVTRLRLEKAVPKLLNVAAQMRNDGRLLFVNELKDPESGRTLTADWGHEVDVLCDVMEWSIPVEWEAGAAVLLSTALIVGTIRRLDPKMTCAEARKKVEGANAMGKEIAKELKAAQSSKS